MVIQIQQGQEREQPEQGTARHGQGCELEHFWQGVRSDKAQWTVWAWVHPPQFPWLVWLRTGTLWERQVVTAAALPSVVRIQVRQVDKVRSHQDLS